MVDRPGTRASPWVAFVIALVMNLTNLWEPLTVDDVCHQYYAEQVSKDPLHPFEFDLDWHQKPVPAWDVMVAPVNSYYWAPAILLFGGAAGGSTVGWKLWYLPVQFLFCWSLLLLLRRVAERHAHGLLAMLALGPAVLPGLNLMLEVPVLSLGFTSLVLLLRACDRRSLLPAALGGQRACPDRTVAVLTGDGCLMMSMVELSTAARAGLPVKVFVLDDRAYHYMQMLQEPAYRRTTATHLAKLDYEALARGFGVGYVEATRPDQLDAVVKAAVCHAGPVLVRVSTDYGDRKVRWVEAVRDRYTKELTAAQKARFLARIAAREVTNADRTSD